MTPGTSARAAEVDLGSWRGDPLLQREEDLVPDDDSVDDHPDALSEHAGT